MDHKDLDAWKESVELSFLVYTVTNPFPKRNSMD